MDSEPSVEAKNEFYEAMEAKWESIDLILSADRPPDWHGYRFEATIVPDPATNRFSVEAKFGDLSSNRVRGHIPSGIADLLAGLHLEHLGFWAHGAWRKVTIERRWRAETKKWQVVKEFAY